MRWVNVVVLTAIFLSEAGVANAESWCAYPLWVHEWGVQAFDDNGRRVVPVNLPSYFHRSAPNRNNPTPVRHMPPDTGTRALPVLHFYSAGTMGSGDIPLGIEVGFTRGDASAWYPQVDRRRTLAQTRTHGAVAGHERLVRTRRGLDPMRASRPRVQSDPTRQLFWDRLTLNRAPAHARQTSNVPWVDHLRDFESALWVNGASESERFVFYESNSRENVALHVRRGPTYASGRRHYVLENVIGHDVHDVFVTHREGHQTYVFYAPRIPAGRSAGFVLEDHAVQESAQARAKTLWVDAAQPTAPTTYSWGSAGCVMSRDPAVPVETAEGHRLFEQEVDAILRIWARTFFDRPGTSIVYREDNAYVDAMMPLSLYTDMYNFIKLRRLSLAVWRARLP